MLINQEILQKAGLPHLKFLEAIAQLPYVEAIYLFGSRARGDFWENSDIDLAVKYNDEEEYNRRVVRAIIDETSDTFLDIDLIDLNSRLKAEFREVIEKEKVMIYGE